MKNLLRMTLWRGRNLIWDPSMKNLQVQVLENLKERQADGLMGSEVFMVFWYFRGVQFWDGYPP